MKSLSIRHYPLLALLLTPGINNAQTIHNKNQNTKNKEVITMSAIETNKTTIRKLYEEVLNTRNLTLLPNFIAESYAGIQGARGVTAFEAPVAELIKACPDIQWHINKLVGEGDEVVINWTVHGTNVNPFQQYAASGKPFSNDGIAIYELKNGKVTGAKVMTDRLSFLQQLNVLPANLTTLNNKPNPDQLIFIDKFVIPANAKKEFLERTNYNREFIRKLPGFVRDNAYESADANGNILFTTIAIWANEAALNKAKEAVQTEYQRIGFNPAELIKRLNITMDRATYKEVQQ